MDSNIEIDPGSYSKCYLRPMVMIINKRMFLIFWQEFGHHYPEPQSFHQATP